MRKLLYTLFLAGSLQFCQGQVHIQSGAAQQSIPLFDYTDPANRLSTDISLVYVSGNGLKVSQLPSNIGAGWELACGGSIERIQHGEPDDQKNYETYSYPPFLFNSQDGVDFRLWAATHYDNGFLNDPYPITTPVSNAFAYRPYMESGWWPYQPNPHITVDREIDVFSFSFNGRKGSFVIGKKNTSGVSEIRTLEDSKLKIIKIDGDLNNNNNIRTTISEFRITDENGIQYIFKDAELSRVSKYNKQYFYQSNGTFTNTIGTYPGYQGSTEGTTQVYIEGWSDQWTAVRAEVQNSYVKNRWMLSEIFNPLTGKKILFEYEDYSYERDGNKLVERTNTNGSWANTITVEKIAGISKRLKKITLSPVETVEFNYSSDLRADIPTDKRLTDICIKYDESIKTKWEFTQGYFVKKSILPVTHNFTTEDKIWARLCLLGIKNKGNGTVTDPGYSFSYYINNEVGMDSGVPPLFTYAQDYWGYYNPGSGVGFYNPATNGASWAEPLYEPYGGNMMARFMYTNPVTQFAQHTYMLKTPTIEARNGILKSITYPLGGSLTYEYEQNYFVVNNLELKGSGGVRVNKTIEYDGLNHANDIITTYKYVKTDGSSSAWGYENAIYKTSESYRAYKKCSELKFPAVDIGELAVGFHKYWGDYKTLQPSVQRRMASPIEKLVQSTITQILVSIIVRAIAESLQPAYVDQNADTYYSYAVNFDNPLPYQYARVEVKKESPGAVIGKTVFEFTSTSETNPAFAIDFPTLSSPYSSKQRFAYWLYGLPKATSVYEFVNNQERLVMKTENEYNPIKYTLNNDLFLSQKWTPNKMVYNCDFQSTDYNHNDYINHDLYYPICGRVELVKTKKTIYKPTGESTTTTVDYAYSPHNYLLNKETTVNSKGETVEAFTYYPSDYTLGGAIQALKDNNIVNAAVSTQTFITKPGNQKYILTGSFSEFGIIGNGDVKVQHTYSFKNPVPLSSTLVSFNAGQLNPNSSYYHKTASFIHDNQGMVVQAGSGTKKVCTIYDYNNNLPVANVSNANISEVAYSSFETAATGGWNILTGAIIHTHTAITGNRSISGTLTKTSLPAGDYTVTLWTSSNTASTVNGQPGVLTTTVGSWKLYEWKVTNATSVQVVAHIADEIRLYPSGAAMATATYDPLIGKTCECSAQNHLQYYEYDAAGRLKSVKDENRSIIETYQYNYKQ